MSKINAVRLINVNYNNNAIRISDESFHFQGESTLISLRNGGGKSVLVQMMTAPFVHRRYRDSKDRPFESYFTTNKPSFILVEWVLDQGAGYVLTGMMVRRNQDTDRENKEALDMINIISEYREPCIQDIHHLPVVEKGAKEMVLKNFTACRQMFEMYKKDRSMQFFYYDMNNSAQSRQYFDKLKEYQIHFKEWESIIKKVNLKESGLSELFADCRDERGLVEKWFLETIENKLNKDRNRIREFQSILEKYVGQYQDNQDKIRRRDTIRLFREKAAGIQEKAEGYRQQGEKKRKQERFLAGFIEELNRLRGLTEEELTAVSAKIDGILLQIARIEYEKLSCEIHELGEKLLYRTSNRDMLEIERDQLKREADGIERKLHLFACARQQEALEEEQRELETVRQKILVSHRKEEELKPEKDCLGAGLFSYYRQALRDNENQQRENQELYRQNGEQICAEKEKIEKLEQDMRRNASEEGALKSRISAYDRQEEMYNSRYQEQLVRNILGEYEPGTLDILGKAYEKEQEACARERAGKKKEQENGLEQKSRLERRLEELRIGRAQKEMEKKEQTGVREKYESELNARRTVLKYLDMEERELFDKERILHISGKKLMEIKGICEKLKDEERALQKEYQRLTQGRTLELPEALEAELQDMGIPVVYGMEWLQKNGCTEAENLRLVRSHPFLPYALVLTEKELKNLEQHAGRIYTSFPVPIIIREQLEEKKPEDFGSIHRMQGISFYMLFNENLLNEEKLRLLVEEKNGQIRKKRESIERREQEYREYFKRQELIRNQSVDKEAYDENAERLEKLTEELKELDEKTQSGREELNRLLKELERLERELRDAERTSEYQKRRWEDYLQLFRAYEEYEESRQELERCRRQSERLEEQKRLAQSGLAQLEEKQKTLDAEANRFAQRQLWLKEKQLGYMKYSEQTAQPPTGEKLTAKAVQKMEARYEAITDGLSSELQELEVREKRLAGKCAAAAEELEHLRSKYRLEAGAWLGIPYDRREETHQEVLLEDYEKKIERKNGLLTEEMKSIAALEQKKKDRIARMQEVCKEETPLPKKEIQNQDFDGRKNQLQYQKQETEKQRKNLEMHLSSYDENLAALSEYSDFSPGEPITWEQDFAAMNKKELRSFQGILVRDYKQSLQDVQKAREELTHILNHIVRMEAFQDDFYKKPLESMLALRNEAEQVLLQLSTTVQSYDSLMEKLEVDISLVEKEKMKIAELLEDYVAEIHRNLGRIDANSTIQIRERSIKMLKIQLPQWEENENLYRIRIQDLIDETTLKGLAILQKNENVQEYIGTRITTKNLYNTVIGIGNVQIRLYKIEEQREYPITWAEVARNSGGEGFLSAFVILSSLLYYMRKDETDIFAERNEGKVLLMDNPFAQTNAAHLLKPLMDMAEKTNTQLICLTGLGGESIYNRFDNIYVLNLIAASLRSGMQYLRANHLRGNEPETLIVSQVQVMEQQELIF